MKTKCLFTTWLAGALMLLIRFTALAQGTAFIYQGRLSDGGSPATGLYDLQFGLYDAASAGTQQGPLLTNAPTPVTNGEFTVLLDFGNQFPGADRWLEIGVRTNGSADADTLLSPRQQLTPSPYAIFAGSAAGLPGFQVQPNATSPNLIGGYASNYVAPGVYGATIAGGGASGVENHINAIGGTIGGGANNQSGNGVAGHNYTTVGGGYGNIAVGDNSTVGGGENNQAAGANSGVSFGTVNFVGGDYSAIGGGANNTIQNSAGYSTIGGGSFNTNNGSYATIPGGDKNVATNNAFAAGHRAKALNPGAFVWADSTEADFASTSNSQFLIRASGGVGIGTTSPTAPLNVVRPGILGAFFQEKLQDAGGATLSLGANSTAAELQSQGGVPLYLNHGGNNVIMLDSGGGAVGIGTTTPHAPLEINSPLSDISGQEFLRLSFGPNDYNSISSFFYGNPGGSSLAFNVEYASGDIRPVMVLKGNAVGIGTASPSYPLDVQSSQAVGRFVSTSVGVQSVIELRNTTVPATQLGAVNFNDPGNGYPGQIAYSTTDGMTFRAGGTEQMRIGIDGSVGINTTAPAYTLDVNGNMSVNQDAHFQKDVYCNAGYYWCKFNGTYYALTKVAPGDSDGDAFWTSSSDQRLKKDIVSVPGALASLLKLRGVTWEWNELGLEHLTRNIEKTCRSDSGTPQDNQNVWAAEREKAVQRLSKPQMGFIAQEVEKVFPDWVSTDEKGYKQVNLQRLNAVLVNAIKEQQAQIEAQQKEVGDLKGRLERLEQLINAGNRGGQ